jgi:hypothetical protein
MLNFLNDRQKLPKKDLQGTNKELTVNKLPSSKVQEKNINKNIKQVQKVKDKNNYQNTNNKINQVQTVKDKNNYQNTNNKIKPNLEELKDIKNVIIDFRALPRENGQLTLTNEVIIEWTLILKELYKYELSDKNYKELGIGAEEYAAMLQNVKTLQKLKAHSNEEISYQHERLPNISVIMDEYLGIAGVVNHLNPLLPMGVKNHPESISTLIREIRDKVPELSQLHKGKLIRYMQIALLYALVIYVREYFIPTNTLRIDFAQMLHTRIGQIDLISKDLNKLFDYLRDQVVLIKQKTHEVVTVLLNKRLGGYLSQPFQINFLKDYIGVPNDIRCKGSKKNDSFYINQLLDLFIFSRNDQRLGQYFSAVQHKQLSIYLEELLQYYKVIFCAEAFIARSIKNPSYKPEIKIPLLLDLCTSRCIFLPPEYLESNVNSHLSNIHFAQLLRAIEALTFVLGCKIVIEMRDIYIQCKLSIDREIFAQFESQFQLSFFQQKDNEIKAAQQAALQAQAPTPESTNTSLDSPQENLNPERNPLVPDSASIAQVNDTESPVSTVVNDTESPVSTVVANPTNNAPIDSVAYVNVANELQDKVLEYIKDGLYYLDPKMIDFSSDMPQ